MELAGGRLPVADISEVAVFGGAGVRATRGQGQTRRKFTSRSHSIL